jgi:RND family efflux transporter MFP subunit
MRILWVAAGVLLAVAVAVGLRLSGRGGHETDAAPAVTATITTAPVRSQLLQDVATAYGVVQADPAATMTLAAPRPLIVTGLIVRVGQSVAAGQPLIEVASAPAAQMAYQQALNAEASARNDLARAQRLFAAHLVANDQLTAARKALSDAEAALAAQRAQGAGEPRQQLRAAAAGVVVGIAAAVGDRVAQDAVLMTLARAGALSVKLGLEPGGGAFAVGDPVTLKPTAGGPPLASRLTMVGRTTDPATRTIDAAASLRGASWPIGAGVEADVVVGAHQGLTVPRRAVVFDETGTHLFVVRGGRAARVFVTVGRDYGDGIEVKGPIAAGQEVAVEGAYELQDGMAVKVAKP